VQFIRQPADVLADKLPLGLGSFPGAIVLFNRKVHSGSFFLVFWQLDNRVQDSLCIAPLHFVVDRVG
jgi:hypothetical protein